MEKTYQKLYLGDVQNVPLGDFIEFCEKAYKAHDNDVLQLGDHLLLVANAERLVYPCEDCALKGDARLCRLVPCAGSALLSGHDVRYLAILAKGGEHVQE